MLAVKTAPWHRNLDTETVESRARKIQARAAVRAALASGELRRRPCEICGFHDTEAYHSSYTETRFLDVRWVCAIHHREVHAVENRSRRKETFDWRVVVAMTVLAIDLRSADEVERGPDGWDSWLWMLADIQAFAREVLMFTRTIEFHDPPGHFAMERDVALYAWLNRSPMDRGGARAWPPWWPHGDRQPAIQAA